MLKRKEWQQIYYFNRQNFMWKDLHWYRVNIMQLMVIIEKQWYVQIKSCQPKVWKVSDGWRWQTTTEWIKATPEESCNNWNYEKPNTRIYLNRLLKVWYFGLLVCLSYYLKMETMYLNVEEYAKAMTLMK